MRQQKRYQCFNSVNCDFDATKDAKYVDFIHMALFIVNFIIITAATCERSNCYFIATVTSRRRCLPFFSPTEFQCQISLERYAAKGWGEKESLSFRLSPSVILQSNATQKKIFSISAIILNENLAMTETRGISWRENVLASFLNKKESLPGLQRLIHHCPFQSSSLIDL